MIVAIMQPYFFPYVGYFQLIKNADVFVIHEDVQYIKGGWINRNRILVARDVRWITLPVLRASAHQAINQRRYQLTVRNVAKLLRQLEAAYRKAPRFPKTFALCHEILNFDEANVAAFNTNLMKRLASEIGIHTPFISSSQIGNFRHLTGQHRVIEICRQLGATRYINPIGGAHLYNERLFADAGLRLSFLRSNIVTRRQYANTDVPSLSIIDDLMFNDDQAMRRLLDARRLIDATALAYAG